MLMTHFICQTVLKPSSVYEWQERSNHPFSHSYNAGKVLQCRQVGGGGRTRDGSQCMDGDRLGGGQCRYRQDSDGGGVSLQSLASEERLRHAPFRHGATAPTHMTQWRPLRPTHGPMDKGAAGGD